MSYLAIEQLENNISVAQKIRINKSTSLEVIRLNMYKQGTLIDGIVTLEILDGATLLGSIAISYSEFNLIGSNFHGMIGFYPINPIAIKKDYRLPYIELTFRVTVSGYTDSDSSFLGLVRNAEPTTSIYNESNNPNLSDPTTDVWYLPFGLELYTA